MNYVIALFGAVCATLMEYQFRTNANWLSMLWFTIPGAVAINYCVWWLVRAEGMVGGFVVFSFATMLFRVGLTVWAGDMVEGKVWVASGLIVLANLIKVLA